MQRICIVDSAGLPVVHCELVHALKLIDAIAPNSAVRSVRARSS